MRIKSFIILSILSFQCFAQEADLTCAAPTLDADGNPVTVTGYVLKQTNSLGESTESVLTDCATTVVLDDKSSTLSLAALAGDRRGAFNTIAIPAAPGLPTNIQIIFVYEGM